MDEVRLDCHEKTNVNHIKRKVDFWDKNKYRSAIENK